MMILLVVTSADTYSRLGAYAHAACQARRPALRRITMGGWRRAYSVAAIGEYAVSLQSSDWRRRRQDKAQLDTRKVQQSGTVRTFSCVCLGVTPPVSITIRKRPMPNERGLPTKKKLANVTRQSVGERIRYYSTKMLRLKQ